MVGVCCHICLLGFYGYWWLKSGEDFFKNLISRFVVYDILSHVLKLWLI